jgi:tight adherence protein B
MAPLIVIGAAGAAVFGGFYAVSEMISRRNNSGGVRGRLGNITGSYAPEQLTPGLTALQPALQPVGSTTGRQDILPTLTDYLSANDMGKRLRLELYRAGLRLRPGEFVGIVILATVGMGSIGLFFNGHLLMVLIMAAIGFGVPVGILRFKQNERTAKFEKQLPDSLTLIASSLRTGYSFMHATDMVVNEMPPPMSEEFAWVQGEVKLGVPMDQALQRMVTRIKSYDFDLVVTAVSIQLQVGGNLAEILDTIANTIRERVRIKGEIAALTAEGKLSGIIVFILPIVMALYLNLQDRNYFKPLLNDPSGPAIIYSIIFMMCLGGIIIKKMVDVDV